MNSRLDSSVCVVAGIGGAIGSAIADRFSAEGATVIGIDRREFECAYPVVRADLVSDVDTEAAFERIHDEYGLIDVLYVNAGPLNPNDHGLLETSSTVWAEVMTGVLSPAVNACRYGVPHLQREVRGSSVILTGSFLAGMGAATAQMAFSAAKAAVTQLGRDLGVHLARSGVRVNTIALGPVLTPELEAMFERLGPTARSGASPTCRCRGSRPSTMLPPPQRSSPAPTPGSSPPRYSPSTAGSPALTPSQTPENLPRLPTRTSLAPVRDDLHLRHGSVR